MKKKKLLFLLFFLMEQQINLTNSRSRLPTSTFRFEKVDEKLFPYYRGIRTFSWFTQDEITNRKIK